MFSAISRAANTDTYYFFIPQTAHDEDYYTYVYDTKLDRILIIPNNKNLRGKLEPHEINPGDRTVLLNKIILSKDIEARQIQCQDSSPLKVIKIDDNWIRFSIEGKHIVLPRELMIESVIHRQKRKGNIPIGREIVNKDTSLPQDYVPDDLVKINQKWNYHTKEYPKYLRKYVAIILERMLQNAEDQGIHIRVFSAYRSYEKQRYLYLKALSRSGLQQNSVAKPGHSEHQLGTAVDFCGLDPNTVLNQNFGLTKEGRWLRENALKFGFHQSYTEENQHETGYIPEPWHYRFKGVKRQSGSGGMDL